MKIRLIKSEIPASAPHTHTPKSKSCCGLCAALRAVLRGTWVHIHMPHRTWSWTCGPEPDSSIFLVPSPGSALKISLKREITQQ